jgi:hypothetical protein
MLAFVEECMARGIQATKVHLLCRDKFGAVTATYVWGLIAAVRTRWEADRSLVDRDGRRDELRALARSIVEEARQRKELPTALRALDFLAKLDGLYDAETIAALGSSGMGANVISIVAIARAREATRLALVPDTGVPDPNDDR